MSKFQICLENEEVLEQNALEEDNIDIPELEESITETSNEINEEQAETDRTIDTVEAMEALRDIMMRIKSPSNTDIALFQTVANMAVAGTNTPAQAILPAMESFSDMTIAIESMNQKIAIANEGIWDGIKSVTAKIGKLITSFTNIFKTRLTLLNNLEKTISEVSKSKTKSNIEFTISKTSEYFTNKEGKVFSSYKDMVSYIPKYTSDAFSLSKDVDAFVSGWSEATKKHSKIYASSNSKEEAIDGYTSSTFDYLSKLTKSSNFTKNGSLATLSLPGCKSFNISNLSTKQSVNKTIVFINNASKETKKDFVIKVDFNDLTKFISESRTLLNKSIEQLNAHQKWSISIGQLLLLLFTPVTINLGAMNIIYRQFMTEAGRTMQLTDYVINEAVYAVQTYGKFVDANISLTEKIVNSPEWTK